MCPESDVFSEARGMVKVMCVLKQSAHVDVCTEAERGGGQGCEKTGFR
jgi:hypothetical protein